VLLTIDRPITHRHVRFVLDNEERTDSANEAYCTASSSPARECTNSTDDDLIHDLTDLSLYEKKTDTEVKDTVLEEEAEGSPDKQDGAAVSKSARKRRKKTEKAAALLAGIVDEIEDNKRGMCSPWRYVDDAWSRAVRWALHSICY
jgi:hypothetical protein